MSQFNIGDVVKRGNGKVEYVVASIDGDKVTVESMNTGKPVTVDVSALTLLRAAETEPMNVPLSAPVSDADTVQVSDTEEAFDPREDRRQSAYGLAILAAVLRKDPRAGMTNRNALKPIGSTRAKVRKRVKAERTRYHQAGQRYNAMVREYGQYTPNAA